MITTARRKTGHLQQELADALGLDACVLSRKLHGKKKSILTHTEVKQIIRILAAWDAITTDDEAINLLTMMGLTRESFSEQEWASTPLNRLEKTTQMIPTGQSSRAGSTLFSVPYPMTSLIGREQQVTMIQERLRQHFVRLLTLFGSGGVGKTRLALEAGHTLQDVFTDGVVFLSLASLQHGQLLPAMLIQVLHSEEAYEAVPTHKAVSHTEALFQFLREKHLLLILDNVEHILDIAPFIDDLLQQTRHLKILVTSRIMLQLPREATFEVPPLALSPSPHLDTGEPDAASRLFLERAQAVDSTFRMTQDNKATIAHICTHLDGLPLAIELAAARTKVVSLHTLLQRVMYGRDLTFLRTTASNVLPRHQTLEATLDWSYHLLEPLEQALFRRASVFVGGWTLEAAQAIIVGEEAWAINTVLEHLERLLNQSLLHQMHVEKQVDLRFYLLETIRAYAWAQLDRAGERAEIQRRHASYYLTLVERLESHGYETESSLTIDLLVQDQENLRAARSWALDHNDPEIALRMSSALGHFWERRMQFREAHRWADAVFEMKTETATALRAKLLLGSARLALWEIGYERSRELAQEALHLYESIQDQQGKVWALFQIGDTWHIQGEYTHASRYLEECLHLLKEQKDWHQYTFTLSRLGALATLRGEMVQAHLWLDEAILLLRKETDPGLLTMTLVYQGILSFLQRDLKQSALFLRESFLLAQQTENHYMLATTLLALGCVLGFIQGPLYTAQLCSAAEQLYAEQQMTVPLAYRSLYETTRDKMQAHVEQSIWEAWWEKGHQLSHGEIAALVLTTQHNEE